jgi:2,4-dienoyl-CoA reductase-like NADH-dependent reductase (Old Yellow Enzyme family)
MGAQRSQSPVKAAIGTVMRYIAMFATGHKAIIQFLASHQQRLLDFVHVTVQSRAKRRARSWSSTRTADRIFTPVTASRFQEPAASRDPSALQRADLREPRADYAERARRCCSAGSVASATLPFPAQVLHRTG